MHSFILLYLRSYSQSQQHVGGTVMKHYSATKVFMFGVINFVTSILSLIAIVLFFGLAFAFTPQDLLARNFVIFAIFFLVVALVDLLKWFGFHYITKHRKKAWYIFYTLYIIFFAYLGFLLPYFFILVAVYIIIFISMEVLQK